MADADRTRRAEADRAAVERLRAEILVLDEVLTMSAHMAAATGSAPWQHRYRENEPRLRVALARGQELAPDPAGTVATAQANEALVAMEERALSLAGAGKLQAASDVLMSRAYVERKAAFAQGIAYLVQRLDAAREASAASQQLVSRVMLAVGLVGLFGVIGAWLVAFRAVRAWRSEVEHLQADLSGTRAALLEANENLEGQVAERSRLAEARAEEVERLAHELVAVEALERQKLARILHDHLQQLLVGALFGEAAAFQRKHPVGVFDGAQPVCDHERRATLHQALQRFLHLTL